MCKYGPIYRDFLTVQLHSREHKAAFESVPFSKICVHDVAEMVCVPYVVSWLSTELRMRTGF